MAVNHYTRLAGGVDTTVLDLARRHQEGRVSEDDTTVTFRFTDRDYSPAPARRRGSGAARGYWGLLAATMKGQVCQTTQLRALVANATPAGRCRKSDTSGQV